MYLNVSIVRNGITVLNDSLNSVNLLQVILENYLLIIEELHYFLSCCRLLVSV